jgi:carboxypeptidase C (cathepsin A)
MAESTDTTAASSTVPAPGADAEAAKRQRAYVDKLLARAPTQSTGQVRLVGSTLHYAVHAAFLPVAATGLHGAAAEPEAAVLATSYLAQDRAATDAKANTSPAARPVCFAFNGGPGSASVWLHLGALGPKRVVVPEDGGTPVPPYTVEDNPHSWLEHFDLVFIDPPHTGWSTTASDAAKKKMLSVDGDVKALTEVIRVWLTRHGRWGSPVYLAGESYGTTRGAAIADQLLGLGVALVGVVLVSCAMDFQSIVFAPGHDLPCSLFLPAFANTAQRHGLLRGAIAKSPQAARAAAEDFVQNDYFAALQAGARLAGTRRTAIARRVAELTGLPQALVEQQNLRISDTTFFFEALRDRGLIVGRLDSRVTGPMAARRTRQWEFDPGIEAISAPYTTAAMAYYRELGLDIEQRYEVLNMQANESWTWQRGEGKGDDAMGFPNTSPDLARALRRNPNLRVFVASGRYDLGTPYSASDWSLAQLDVPPQVMARVQHHYYDAGHMMYTRPADLKQLKKDLAQWLAAA